MIKTLEQLAGWLLFSLSILMVYGLLSMFLIDAARAQQPTFAQIVWDRGLVCIKDVVDEGAEDDGDDVSLGTWCPGDPEPQE